MTQLSFVPKLKFFRTGFFKLTTIVLCVLSVRAGAQERSKDSVSYEPYSWIRPEANYIQFYEPIDLLLFYKKWIQGPDSLITIAHFGDSHVQPDIYSGELRKQLQEVRGFGGLGMMFPFSTAKTYSTINYISRHTGEWHYAKSIETYPRLALGASGATCKTADATASFTIEFKTPQPDNYRKLKIYCRQQKNSYDMIIRSGGQETLVAVDDSIPRPYVEVELPARDNSITVQLVKRHDYENDFEFYGMSLESTSHSGLILHSLGIGGSQYGSLLKQVLLDPQLSSLEVDLVILDFGTNDYLYENSIPPELESQIIRVIRKVRKAAPQATVFLTTAQDMYRRGKNITAGVQFSDLIRKVAKSQKCPFYDWYWISGGPEKMIKWQQHGLARTDMIHLTEKGYTLKGRMLADAVRKCMQLLGSARPDSLIIDIANLQKNIAISDSLMSVPDSLKMIATKVEAIDPNIVNHHIQQGETLKSIAKIYKVKIDAIKKLNGFKNNKIVTGNYLKIKVNNAKVASAKMKPDPGKSNADYVLHKVQKEDTLSELAQKYKVTVAQLKVLNGLKTSRIKTGQTLKIKLKADSTTRK